MLTKVAVDTPNSEPVRRRVYKYGKANSNQLRGSLLAQDWRPHLEGTADEAAAAVTKAILHAVATHIPQARVTDKLYARPWLNTAGQLGLERTHAAEQTADFPMLREACAQAFL